MMFCYIIFILGETKSVILLKKLVYFVLSHGIHLYYRGEMKGKERKERKRKEKKRKERKLAYLSTVSKFLFPSSLLGSKRGK